MKLATIAAVLLFALAAAACAAGPSAAVSLENTYWRLVRVYGKPVPAGNADRQAHLVFSEDGRLTGSGGCNRLTGSYRKAGDRIELGPMGITHMACADGMALETAFLQALGEMQTYTISAATLTFHAGGRVLAVFEAGRD